MVEAEIKVEVIKDDNIAPLIESSKKIQSNEIPSTCFDIDALDPRRRELEGFDVDHLCKKKVDAAQSCVGTRLRNSKHRAMVCVLFSTIILV